MLRQFGLAVLLNACVVAQTHAPIAHFEQLDEIRKTECKAPEGFGCAILWNVDLADRGDMIVSLVGGVIRQLSVIIDQTTYTVVYEPPLQRDDRMRRKARVPARVDGDSLIIRWPNGTESKGKIVKREKVNPNRPQPA
jgi:hypothetical protein